MLDSVTPGAERGAESRLARHHTAGAIGNADGVENVGDPLSEGLEPAVLRSAGVSRLEDRGVVLVEGEEALAAPGRAEHQKDVKAGACAVPHLRQLALGDLTGPADEAPSSRAMMAPIVRR